MDCIKPPLTKHKLTSLFSLPSAATEKAAPKSSAPATTCERKRQRNGGRAKSILFLVLLDLWGAVPIIILITTTGAPTTVSAVSIAAVSIAPNGDGKGSGNVDRYQQQHHHKPGQSAQPHKLSFHSGNDANGNPGSVGVLNLGFGELYFANKRQQQEAKQVKETNGKSIKKEGTITKRNVGDARITSNQDVTTLALAVDNSSSVAISNINSQYNNVYVTIGNNPNNRFETGNRFDPYPPYNEETYQFSE